MEIFGINPNPEHPPSQAAIDQVQREKAAERAAKCPAGMKMQGDWYVQKKPDPPEAIMGRLNEIISTQGYTVVPLSETEEYHAAVEALVWLDNQGLYQRRAIRALLDLIKQRETAWEYESFKAEIQGDKGE